MPSQVWKARWLGKDIDEMSREEAIAALKEAIRLGLEAERRPKAPRTHPILPAR